LKGEKIKMRFKVGDKVRVRKDLKVGNRYFMSDGKEYNSFVTGMAKFAGEIVTISRATAQYKIEECEYCQWVDEMFEPINERKIVITADGKETIARLYDGKKVIKSATAKCSPKDEFYFETGAKIVFERLIEETLTEEKPIEKKPKLKIEVGKRYMLKPYSDVMDAVMLNGEIWRRDFSQPVEVIGSYNENGQGFHVECANKNKWFVDESSFLCECIDIETE
jgi:hypothetical protein